MSILQSFIQPILHIDQNLIWFMNTYGAWVYGLLFLIIFSETGLVILPFLPGDSLLFTVGTVAANTDTNDFNIHILFFLLLAASITGNIVNYLIGRFIGQALVDCNIRWLFNKNHLAKTHDYYERHGGKTLILARFIPVIRSFAPFVAGMGQMGFKQFSIYNVIGALLWVGILIYTGYWFGNLPFIQHHFSTVILGIIIVSLLPLLLTLRRRK